MRYNVSFKEIGDMLEKSDNILLFPHVNPDGDALGSALALCMTMRAMGKNSWVLLEEEVPAYIDFLDVSCCTQDQNCIDNPEVCLCVDCGEENRMPERIKKFNSGKTRICIDHHSTGGSFGDYYYIDEDEAATAQIVYKLIKTMGWELSSSAADALYTGIVTDTGSFQYSNTTPDTHKIASELLAIGVDSAAIAVKLYQNVSLKKLRLQSRVIEDIDIFADGRAVIAYISQNMLKEAEASDDDGEGIIDFIKSIDGVEIAALLKERGEAVKVSMRAKSYARVDKIAVKFGGGGHVKAAGCTLDMDAEKAAGILKNEITEALES